MKIDGRCRGCKRITEIDELTRVCEACVGTAHLQHKPVPAEEPRARYVPLPGWCPRTSVIVPNPPGQYWHARVYTGQRIRVKQPRRTRVACPTCGQSLIPRAVGRYWDHVSNVELFLLSPEDRVKRLRNRQDEIIYYLPEHKPPRRKRRQQSRDHRQQPRRR